FHETLLSGNEIRGKFQFLFLQLKYLFLYGISCNELVREDLLALPDTMGAVYGLGFHGRIPPGIEDENIVCFRKIQPQATGFDGDQKNPKVRLAVEALHLLFSVDTRTVEVGVIDLVSFQEIPDNG